ncbi:MAG: hypothetical protein HY462_01610 [Parcubacteria group bacterium]|nr:hypothetical protein [Parcubacteria group bacterium]
MWFSVIISALLTTWLDSFFLPALDASHALSTSTVALVLFLEHRSNRASFAFAAVSGVLMDMASSGAPFGLHLLMNVGLFVFARALMRQFFPASSAFSIMALAAAVSEIGVVFAALAGYFVNALRASGGFPFWSAVHPIALATTPMLAAVLAGCSLYAIRATAALARQWLFVRRRT